VVGVENGVWGLHEYTGARVIEIDSGQEAG
jgi:hypothetical protein